MNFLDRMIMWMSPGWGRSRAQSRLVARNFEAASVGRRTSGWARKMGDANAAAGGPALAYLRAQARDLVRNNPWARRGLGEIAMDVVGWGIKPKAVGPRAERVMELWDRWGETTECDAQGRLTFYGLQYLAMRTVVESGEVLIRRRFRRPEDGLAIPMQLQILEPDYIDTGKNVPSLNGGGRIVQGVEFDGIGRRAAYWLFDKHPGESSIAMPVSKRIPADGILHVFDMERPGQVRGPSWFASVDVRLHDLAEYEDATLMKQKIAACMAAFVTDVGDGGVRLGGDADDDANGQQVDTFEPGMILNLPAGKEVTVANPPVATDYQSFSTTQLRAVAAGLGIPYEALGDYSQVNYSSARMAANKYLRRIHHWRWNILITQFCAPAWMWMLGALDLVGEAVDVKPAEWTPPPNPMLDPDKEAAATTRMIRAGQMTHDDMVREQGYDPEKFWPQYAAGLKRLDSLGIILDSDPRKTNNSGQAQADPAAQQPAKPTSNGVPKNGAKPAAAASETPSA